MRQVNPALLHALRPTLLGFVAFVLLASLPQPASAIEMQGSEIVIELELPNDSGDLSLPSEETRREYFNLANCVCPDITFGAKLSLDNPATSYESRPVEIWVGNGCDVVQSIQDRDDTCEFVDTVQDIEDLRSITRRNILVHSLAAPNSEQCSDIEDTRSIYTLIDEGGEGVDAEDYVSLPYDIPVDMRPPPIVEDIRVAGAEQAIQINWATPSSRSDDLRFIQVLCARSDGSESAGEFPNSDLSPEYLTSLMVCNSDIDGAHPVPGVLSRVVAGPQIDAGLVDAGSIDAAAALPDAMPSGPDAGVSAPLPAELHNLNPSTLCGEVTGTETGVRVDGLENGVSYRIVLVMVDAARNATALDLGDHIPQPVQDAWEHYQEAGGNADGGYCFVATATYGNYDHPFVKILRTFRDDTLAHNAWGRGFIQWYYDNSPELAAFIGAHPVARAVSYILLAPLVVFAAVLEYTTLLGKFALLFALGLLVMLRRRRSLSPKEPSQKAQSATPKRRLLVATAGILVVLGFSATAHAQPYWDELNEDVQMEGPAAHWNLEIKVGPYFPDVDSEVAGAAPFEEVFGGKGKIMTILSLDRFFSFPAGQLGITGSIGYSSRSANAFEIDSMGNAVPDPNKPGEFVRSEGDKTGFTLVPTTIGIVYRFTMLDDEFRIPIVPYAKLGLSYYLWRFTAPNGDTSESPTDGCPIPGRLVNGKSCEGNLARGASLGYQGTVGIAIRAERIDPKAALSLRNEMGVEHAGFFLEGQLAVVDGFGADKKLSVGDATWFAGINFEF